jgi:ribosomal protein L29
MKIEITVVTTETLTGKANPKDIEEIKREICEEFGKIYILSNQYGVWHDKDGKEYKDISETWQIFTDKPDAEERIKFYADRIKEATKQIAQLYTIDKETKANFS